MICTTLVGVIALGDAATASELDISGLDRISGKDPYADLCGVDHPISAATASGPSIAVDPTDPDHMIAAWNQNWPLTVLTATTFDDGRTWTHRGVPGVQRCTGGPAQFAVFPQVTFGPDGKAYLAVTSASGGFPPTEADLLVSRALKGGKGWSQPVTVANASGNDGASASLAVDPRNPKRVTAVWHREVPPLYEGEIRVATSLNGARTWSEPRIIHRPDRPGKIPFGNALSVTPGGTLLYTYVSWEIEQYAPMFLLGTGDLNFVLGSRWKVELLRSTDGGETWSEPNVLGFTGSALPQATDSGKLVNIDTMPSLAVRKGRVAVAWHSIDSPNSSTIQVATSTNRGASFEAPAIVRNLPGHAFLPTIAYDHRGNLAMSYYDLLDDDTADDELTTTAHLIASTDGGTSWSGRALGMPFDMLRTVPSAYGVAGLETYLPGMSEALVPVGRRIYAGITLGPSTETGFGATILGTYVRVRR